MKIRVTRPCMLNGEPVVAGSIFDLQPRAAYDAVASGRCEYVEPADAAVADAATREATDRLMHTLNASEQAARASWMLQRKRA